MERSEIISAAKNLSARDWGDDLRYAFGANPDVDGEWRGEDHGASFKLSKHQGAVPIWRKGNDHLELQLMGKRNGREKLRQDFVAALGKPSEERGRIMGPSILLWDGRTTLKPQRLKVKT